MTETVLLVGGGGREHALAYALRRGMDRDSGTDDVRLVACAEHRNPGIARAADDFVRLETTDADAVLEYAESIGADIAVIGAEAPLEAGVSDALAEADIYPFGPSAALARIETDKAFQRSFMQEHDIPGCPAFETFDDPEEACAYIDDTEVDLAIKPTGLTGGKGVKIMGEHFDAEGAKAYVRESGYDAFVLEERLIGEEFTVQAFVANGELRVTPAVQDHKRAFEGDEGPNTGGMGSYSAGALELPFMRERDYHDAVEILKATVDALEGYTGVLYGQFMLTGDGVYVIEYNARFGDPEAMNTLSVMNTSLHEVIRAAREETALPQLSFAPRATVCKYVVPEGYPDDPADGVKLDIDAETAFDDALLYYASVDERDDGIYSTTSRSLAVVGIGDTIAEAEAHAEDALTSIGVGDLHVRHDIGTDSLIQRRIDHMDELRDTALGETNP